MSNALTVLLNEGVIMASGGSMDNALAVQLYKQAVDFSNLVSCPWNQGRVLYRCKPDDYFNNIMQSGGLMSRYKKDNNGDRNNPMNGKVDRLFFMANVRHGTQIPPDQSPLGPRRLDIPIDYLLRNFKPNGWKLFFNDFFCMTYDNDPHYVTLAMCEVDNTDDYRFCEKYLLPLPEDNPFFMIAEDGESFRVSSKIWVELLYMKNINICDAVENGAHFENIEMTGSGPSANGIPKPSNCETCNIKT